MATQYKDGTWSQIEPLNQARETFEDALQANLAKKFVVGSEEEIEQEQNQEKLAEQIEELKDRLNDLETKNSNSPIEIPNYSDILRFGQSEE